MTKDKLIRRGDIVMAPFGLQNFCPAVVLSDGLYNQQSGTVIAVPLFKDKPAALFPLSHQMSQPLEGQIYWAKPGQVKTFSALSLGYITGHADSYDLEKILQALREILGDPFL